MRLPAPWLVNYLDSILHTAPKTRGDWGTWGLGDFPTLGRSPRVPKSPSPLLLLGAPALRALLLEVLNDRLVFQRLDGVERGAPVGVRGIDVDALRDDELHRFEHQRFPIAALGLRPRRPAAHADRRHQCRRLIAAMLKAGAAATFDDVIAMMHDA